MKKAYVGARLRRLREQRGMTQQALATAVGVSPSYLNQIENNQRPLTVPVLLKLNATLGIDVQLFSEDDEARLIADLKEALSDPLIGESMTSSDVRELASNMPAAGRALVAIYRRYHFALEQSSALAARLGDDRQDRPGAPVSTPFEEVRDFFYARHNYIAELDEAAELTAADVGHTIQQVAAALVDRLRSRHGVEVRITETDDQRLDLQRSFSAGDRTLRLSARLQPGQQAFQMGTQLAFLEHRETIDALVGESPFGDEASRKLARIGLANYFAGALLLPYGVFRQKAEAVRYDIARIGRHFGVGYETICHRLSTLQRPGARGVPFFFIRVDRAGNISKRQSATDFHFSRGGGTCPLWNVYEAFSQPDRILTQLARMPDDRTYLWVARTVSHDQGGYHAPRKTFAVALGCDLQHAGRLVYSDGLDLSNPSIAIPIGAGCRICERPACPQRAFPPVGRTLHVDENCNSFSPYSTN
ncbi:XRE family transcriptional regulator [Rhodopseudomonas sp. WA056]|uniref:short-chain fatty acyl-CoA regulator family protein n=1 Tax=Rhodopseudomonas sp. WA056 TaxID=2269367 RepID=UPI0013E09434|nr:short-chain fatty acyl-CoA regulator family protein [Rhodopseudomonas sp. WA056]NEW87071.1 XRE family transcriptional regulator [Rhodopseudomonas sp. WA056]